MCGPVDSVLHVFVVTTAQDLLEQWAAEKLNFNDAHMDNDYLEIPGIGVQTSKTASEVKREWDRLVEVDTDDCFTSVRDTENSEPSGQNSKRQKNKGRKKIMNLISAKEL